MFFTVYIPMFNSEKYIAMAIDSVLAQSFKDFELLIIDDGSTDNSLSIAEKYVKTDERIRIISKSNAGLFQARITAFENARGEFVVSLDADDLLVPSALEVIKTTINCNLNCDIVYYGMKRVRDSSERIKIRKAHCNNDIIQTFEEGKNIKEYYRKLIFSDKYNPMWKKAIRRELLRSNINELKAFSYVTIGEDNIHTLYASLCSRKIIEINSVLYLYRYNRASMTNHINDYVYQSWSILMEQRERFLSKYRMNDCVKDFNIFKKKSLIKLLAYNPYRVKGDKEKEIYMHMLSSIRSEKSQLELLDDIKSLSIVYKIPGFLFRHNLDVALLFFKNCVAIVRAFLIR